MSSDQKKLFLNSLPHEIILSELKDAYEREWIRKSNIENKISNNITISGLIVTLLFGFVAFVFPPSNSVPHLQIIILILLVSIILEVICLFLSVIAYRQQDYDFIFSLLDESMLNQYKQSRSLILINSLIDQYRSARKKNAGENNKKVGLINIAQGLLLTGITLVPFPVAIMLFK